MKLVIYLPIHLINILQTMVIQTPGRGTGWGMGGKMIECCLPHYLISATVCSYAAYPVTALLILMLLSTVPVLPFSFLCS